MTGFLSNAPLSDALVILYDLKVSGRINLRGQCMWKCERLFLTHPAQPYPNLLAERYALIWRETEALQTLAKNLDLPVPRARKCQDPRWLTSMWQRVLDKEELELERPDAQRPFVPKEGGTPAGLCKSEHIAWAHN